MREKCMREKCIREKCMREKCKREKSIRGKCIMEKCIRENCVRGKCIMEKSIRETCIREQCIREKCIRETRVRERRIRVPPRFHFFFCVGFHIQSSAGGPASSAFLNHPVMNCAPLTFCGMFTLLGGGLISFRVFFPMLAHVFHKIQRCLATVFCVFASSAHA